MRRDQSPSGGLLPKLLLTTALGYGLHHTWPAINGGGAEEWQVYAWAGGAVLAALGTGAILGDASVLAQNVHRRFRALRPAASNASAKWLTKAQARRAGLGRTSGLFLGIMDGLPLFIPNAVHGLVCAPARKGKTTSFVMPALCHDLGASRIVADMKGDLAAQTAALIRARHGQDVIILNPAHKFDLGNAPYNPMQIIRDDLERAQEDAIADAWSMAFQLVPQAPGGDRDPFWPNGTRKLLVFVIVGLCALGEDFESTLPRAFEVLGDNAELERLLQRAQETDVLAGALANLAVNIAGTLKDNPKHFESFREGAVQALVAFGPSGHLAASMDGCAFRFRDLKAAPATLFMVCDYSRMDVFAPWLGLLMWAALKELVREDNDVPVYFILDEFTNYRLSGLPNALTALGGYGVRCLMVVQELKEIARVYGHEALSTILGQSDVKQFFGVSSFETAQLVSRMLGEEELNSESFGMGAEVLGTPSLNLGRRAKLLMNADEVRRLPEDEQIIFVKNLPPIRALKAGYQEIAPWAHQVAGNPLHGGRAFLGRVKMRLKAGKARATRAGRRVIARTKRPLFRPLLAAASLLVPGKPVLLFGAAVCVVLGFGLPHLRIEYTATHNWCRYAGLPFLSAPFEVHGQDHCPLIKWGPAQGGIR